MGQSYTLKGGTKVLLFFIIPKKTD